MNRWSCFLILFLLSLTACHVPPAPENAANMKHLEVGMTQDQVRQLLGDPHDGKGTFAKNPNIWYYYTQTVWRDGNVTREECTPVCFDPKTGKLVGWGYEFRNKYIHYADWNRQNWSQPAHKDDAVEKPL